MFFFYAKESYMLWTINFNTLLSINPHGSADLSLVVNCVSSGSGTQSSPDQV